MKNKLLILLFFCVAICITTYFIFKNEKFYYLALGEIPKDQYRYEYQDYVRDYLIKEKKNFKFNKNFLREDYTIENFLTLINEAKVSVNNGELETITKAINNASLITINLGNNDMENIINQNRNKLDIKKNKQSIDKVINNYEEIIRKIRFLTDSPVIIVGLINTFPNNKNTLKINELYKYAESKISEFNYFEDVYFIPLVDKFTLENGYLEKLDKLSPSIKGYKYISDQIIDIYNNEIN